MSSSNSSYSASTSFIAPIASDAPIQTSCCSHHSEAKLAASSAVPTVAPASQTLITSDASRWRRGKALEKSGLANPCICAHRGLVGVFYHYEDGTYDCTLSLQEQPTCGWIAIGMKDDAEHPFADLIHAFDSDDESTSQTDSVVTRANAKGRVFVSFAFVNPVSEGLSQSLFYGPDPTPLTLTLEQYESSGDGTKVKSTHTWSIPPAFNPSERTHLIEARVIFEGEKRIRAAHAARAQQLKDKLERLLSTFGGSFGGSSGGLGMSSIMRDILSA